MGASRKSGGRPNVGASASERGNAARCDAGRRQGGGRRRRDEVDVVIEEAEDVVVLVPVDCRAAEARRAAQAGPASRDDRRVGGDVDAIAVDEAGDVLDEQRVSDGRQLAAEAGDRQQSQRAALSARDATAFESYGGKCFQTSDATHGRDWLGQLPRVI